MSRSRKFPKGADLTTPCAVCGRPFGEHAGQKCPPNGGLSDPACLCGHLESQHTRAGKFKGLCAECSCELFERAPDAIRAARTLAPDRKALPGQLGMLGAAGRNPDGRAGVVFSLRLTKPEREMLEAARAREAELARAEGRWLGRRPLGLWIREAALARAFAVVDGPRSSSSSSSPSPRRSR